jgi:hypothetical protein
MEDMTTTMTLKFSRKNPRVTMTFSKVMMMMLVKNQLARLASLPRQLQL